MNHHAGIKPYTCKKCQAAFSQSSNMKTHYRKCLGSTDTPEPTTSGVEPAVSQEQTQDPVAQYQSIPPQFPIPMYPPSTSSRGQSTFSCSVTAQELLERVHLVKRPLGPSTDWLISPEGIKTSPSTSVINSPLVSPLLSAGLSVMPPQELTNRLFSLNSALIPQNFSSRTRDFVPRGAAPIQHVGFPTVEIFKRAPTSSASPLRAYVQGTERLKFSSEQRTTTAPPGSTDSSIDPFGLLQIDGRKEVGDIGCVVTTTT